MSDPREREGSADALLQIQLAVSRVRGAETKGMLGILLAKETLSYSLFDLQIIGGRLNSEVEKLPSPYRESILPFFRQQLFGRHHQLIGKYRSGVFTRMNAPLRDKELFWKFCDVIPEGCFSKDDIHERNPYFRNPRNHLFYYLVAAFTMFVLDEPGHPVGMPFPGGYTVEQRGRDYYCLIRDKEKEIPHSICNFCPALQNEDPPGRS
ncbi:DUF2115 domain-containing protein [uncultured Methanoregula sp.]|uniref:DUF2115 domain-containing protein n=1 Tax=uncultured Methanoregula sp. TaxID=1005933 RepID=UPI002AAAB824|nr:DUF2115 domain-containing protein [uncultured Methanoregula sp.]